MSTPYHVYPIGFSIADPVVLHDMTKTGPDPREGEVSVSWVRTRPERECCLCAAGVCVQRVTRFAGGGEVVLHGRTRD